MGEIKRKRKKYSRPKKLFDSVRISRENELIKKYGLKNKKEIWKAQSHISKIRRQAKKLIGSNEEEQKKFLEKLNSIGMNVSSIADVLALTEENLLKRRLQTILFQKKLAKTIRQARQLITHKHVLVNKSVVNIPSLIVTKKLENSIEIKAKKQKNG